MNADIPALFSGEEIWVKGNGARGVRLAGLRSEEAESAAAFRFGRFGGYLALPLKFEIDDDWLYISELLRTDGHISRNLDRIKLTNKDEVLISKFEEFASKLKVGYVRKIKEGNCYRLFIFNKTLCKVFVRVFGFTPGSKAAFAGFPEWMKNLSPEKTAVCLMGAFDGDGCVQHTVKVRGKNGGTRRVRLYGISKQYMEDVKFLLLKLGINSSIFKDPRENRTWFVQISRKNDILLFHSLVGFNQQKRKSMLEEISKTYRNRTILEFEQAAVSILEKEGPLHLTKLAEKLGRRPTSVSDQLDRLKSARIVERRLGNKRMLFPLENGPPAQMVAQ